MLTAPDQANLMQCCVEGCGYLNPKDGVRYCTSVNCMGWRWAEPFQVNKDGTIFNKDRVADSKTGPLKMVQLGYCGRAGSPYNA